MLINYNPDYVLTFTVDGSASGAAFTAPDDGSNLADGRTGSVQGFKWIGGTQSLASYVEITCTIASATDSPKSLGAVNVCNVSLPAGTKIVVGGVTQRLVSDARGERNAHFVLHATTSSTFTVRIYNDVNGAPSIVADAEFAVGEIFVGRCIKLCTLSAGNPSRTLQDPTAVTQSAEDELWPLFRKPYWQAGAQFGRYTMRQAKGGTLSDIDDGAGGTIDIQTLDYILSTSRCFAICDTPAEPGDGEFDQAFMQTNWMLARLSTSGSIACDQRPYWTWSPQFREAK
jgi:hypothetical protein